VSAVFPRDLSRPQTWPQCERLLPHALTIAAALTTPAAAGPQLVTLLNGAAEYLHKADPQARGVDTATHALTCAQQNLGPDHPDTLRAAAVLAGSYRYAGRTSEAVELGERVLVDCERILGPEHSRTLSAATMLALAYWDAGRTSEGIELGERTLIHSTRLLGPEHPGTLGAGTVLAMAYWQAAPTTDAVELGERVLVDSERSLGPERPETLRARVTLAVYYTEVGRTIEAIELAERVLPDCVRILGREHPDTLIAGESPCPTRGRGVWVRRSSWADGCSRTTSGSSALSTPARYAPAAPSRFPIAGGTYHGGDRARGACARGLQPDPRP
jgi:tetratricopeptide repeat protein